MSALDSHRLAVKLFVADSAPPLAAVGPVFHEWIQKDALDDVLIDVADYSHVHHGPGVVLVGSEASISMDEEGGRLGLLYKRKRPDPRPARERVGEAFLRALQAARLLEEDERLSGVRFDVSRIAVRVFDALLAPAGVQTHDTVVPLLVEWFSDLYGAPVVVTPAREVGRPFGVWVESLVKVDARGLLERNKDQKAA